MRRGPPSNVDCGGVRWPVPQSIKQWAQPMSQAFLIMFLAMTICWIWLVPSYSRSSRASR